MMRFCCSTILFFGRLCISAIFLLAGISKFVDYEWNSSYMATKGLPYIPFLLVGAALIEVFGALFVIFGYKTRISAFILLLFLIPTTFLFHDFWNYGSDDANAKLQFIMFMQNVSIFGGLLYIIGAGPGGFALDRNCCPSKYEVIRTDA